MIHEAIKIIGGGLFSTQIEVEINDEITSLSQDDLDRIDNNIERIEYLKTIKKCHLTNVSSKRS